MVVDAVSVLDPSTLDLKMIGIKKVQGGGLRDSFLVDGVAFKKTFSYAGAYGSARLAGLHAARVSVPVSVAVRGAPRPVCWCMRLPCVPRCAHLGYRKGLGGGAAAAAAQQRL